MSADSSNLERQVCSEVLKIAAEAYPPDYFKLLGITQDIVDASEIELAATQQAERLRRGTPKELIPAARLVLKRIEKARICLSDANSRRAYLESIANGNEGRLGRPSSKHGATPKPGLGMTQSSPTKAVSPPIAYTGPPPAKLGNTQSPESDIFNLPDLASLSEELGEEQSKTLVGLTDVPYKPKKSNDHLVVVASVMAICVLVLAVIGVIAYFTETSSSTTQSVAVGEQTARPVTDQSIATPPSHIHIKVSEKEVAQLDSTSDSVASLPGGPGNPDKPPIESVSNAQEMGSQSGPPNEKETDVVVNRPETGAAHEKIDKPAGIEVSQTDKPAIPTGSLEGLIAEVELPPLKIDPSNAKAAKQKADVSDLGYLDEEAAKDLQISIDEPQSKLFRYAQFYINRPQASVTVWEIRLKADPARAPPQVQKADQKVTAEQSQLDGSVDGFDEVIASLTLESSNLKFRWGQTGRATLAEQLRNCALVLTTKGLSHRLQLRPQLVAYKFMFDLSKNTHIFEVADEHLPQAEAIRLEVSNVQLPGVTFDLEPATGVIGKGETLRIKTQDGNIPIEFQFVLSVTASKATLKFISRHQLGRRWYPFTGGQVHDAIDDLQRALSDGRGRYSAAQSAISSLPSQISSVESRMRPDSGDYSQLQSQRALLIRQLNSARGATRRLSNAIPEMESKLPQLNSLVTLGKKIHLNGRLDFRAYVPLGEGELILLKTGTEEPPSKGEEAKE